jgi:hypothetical protein
MKKTKFALSLIVVTIAVATTAIAYAMAETSTETSNNIQLQNEECQGFGKMQGRKHFMENAKFEKTNIDNGVELTITSDDANTVAKIQEREQNAPHNKLKNDSTVTRTVTNLDNGIKVTMTSSDTDTVAKLQSDKFHKGPEHAPKNEQSE